MRKLLLTIILIASNLHAQKADPLTVAKRIADRVIKETLFELEEVDLKPASDLQVIDFSKVFKSKNDNAVYAVAKMNLKEGRKLRFGISYSSPVKIWLNNELVFENRRKPVFHFKETAYSIFTFQDTVSFQVNGGINNIVIGSKSGGKSVVYLRELTNPEQPVSAQFVPVNPEAKKYTWPWCYFTAIGKMNARKSVIEYPGKLFIDSLLNNGAGNNPQCTIPEPEKVKRLVIDNKNTFKKDSYADWNYPNGSLMMSILGLYKASDEKRYFDFVDKYCGFTIANYGLVKKQYYKDHDLHGSYYRIFRKSMLDDSGSPSLPFVSLALEKADKKPLALLDEMVKYVSSGQARLADGTLCRPEPEKWTIWADDLFMSVPLIVRYGALHDQKKYFDDAARQIINFNKYLLDRNTNLYEHAWFSRTKKCSDYFWGRANGWVVWATAEALKYLPKDHPSRKQIEEIFTNHLKGIVSCQEKNGMWHQILDDKSTFEESSCTAMFIIGISNAIMSGILDKGYSVNVLNAWNALQRNISGEGIVKDICCGTGIGTTAEFYKTRERPENDPRGLGSVITAALEVDKLEKYLNGN
jgi:rhamnogalacturonyl hydrolase YesR